MGQAVLFTPSQLAKPFVDIFGGKKPEVALDEDLRESKSSRSAILWDKGVGSRARILGA